MKHVLLDIQLEPGDLQRLQSLPGAVIHESPAPSKDLKDRPLPAETLRGKQVLLCKRPPTNLSDATDLLARRVEDENPRVRLEAVRALVMLPSRRSAEVAMRALDRPVDVFLDHALWLTARQLRNDWLPAVESGEEDFEGNARRLVFALQAAGSRTALAPLVDPIIGGFFIDNIANKTLRTFKAHLEK